MKTTSRERPRFLLLRILVVVLGCVLAARVIQIQVFQHQYYAGIALDQWTDDKLIPANRGDIYDRHGRPLALSVTRWRVGVARSLVNDPDRLAATLAPILGLKQSQLQRRLAPGKGHVVLGRNLVLSREEKLTLDGLRAVTLEDMRSRIYPFGPVGASLIGRFNHEAGRGSATALELGLHSELAGTPGNARTIKRAGSSEGMGQVTLQQAVHGNSLVLTLDADLQAICEARLAEAVQEKNAKGGSVLITDPATGDILAAASWPLLDSRASCPNDDRLWQNANFVDVFEPGSVFKIFSTASLLRNAAIDTATIFDCSDGSLGSFTIRNDDGHRYGDLPLMRAFAKSSNIYFARAVGNLTDQEFYRDLVDFGFGQKTTLPYPGQAEGILHRPSDWEGRSRPTIAIGQEIAVTPLQLNLAVGAVANGGVLYSPRLVKEVRDHEGRLLEERPPVALRRIFSEPLAALLREAMRRVVSEGTGQAAQASWIQTGGKTGTAQKADGHQGYIPGAYIASFAGLVPVEQPRLVILTVLDEPQGWRQYYAAQSAVPLFKNVVSDIRMSTDWLDDVPGSRSAPMSVPVDFASVTVPDVLHLNGDKAARKLAAQGLEISGNPGGGIVVEQIPSAGSLVPRGQTVHLTLAGGAGPTAQAVSICPDLKGLSNRQVHSLAARLGLALETVGQGYVVKQSPAPGTALTQGRIKVRMGGLER